MKLFRVYMTLYYTTGELSGAHRTPTFYVHAVNGEHAKTMAMLVTNPGGHFPRTSGSAIAVGPDNEGILETYFSWGD